MQSFNNDFFETGLCVGTGPAACVHAQGPLPGSSWSLRSPGPC